MNNHERSTVQAKRNPDGKRQNRGETVRRFLEQIVATDFSLYPRMAEAAQVVDQSLVDLGVSPTELKLALVDMFASLSDPNHEKTIWEMGNDLQGQIHVLLRKQLDLIGPTDELRFAELDKALRSLMVRALEVLAVYQKQEREHTASHRAHSSKTDGEFAFGGPELSIWALETAMKQGVRNIEIDVTALADGTPVVTHNLSASTVEGKKKIGTISNLPEAEALGATIDRTGASIYGLEELLTIAEKYRGLARLNLEVKDAAAVPKIVELIQRHGLQNDIIVSSFNPKVVLDIHATLPEVTLGVNSFVTEHNIDTILAEPQAVNQPWVLPGGVAVGGNQLPDANVNYATYTTLPEPLRQALRDTNGYLTVQVPLAKLGFGKDKIKALAAQAKAEGFHLLMFRVTPNQAAILRDEVDLLHLDAGEELTYPRMGKPLHSSTKD